MNMLEKTSRAERSVTVRLRNHNTPCEMPVYPSLDAWMKRGSALRETILASCGLLPALERNPLKPKIFGKKEGDGYVVEKVFFCARPGFYLCGNLYRPATGEGPFPGILLPHGHFQWGRLGHNETGSMPLAGISMARLGFVAFSYDMIGYNDTLQLPHNFGGRRESLWGLNLMGLQLWNSIRALDFMESLDYIDSERLGCTGASGGGTQTFMLSAVDERVKVSAPAVMISAHMQGGCLCENAPGLRIDANNMEIAALVAPRPMLMVAATGDWTRNTPEVEYPAVKSVYDLFDAGDRIEYRMFDASHNFNRNSREAIYAWFGRWFLGEDDPEKFREAVMQPDQPRDLLVFYARNLPEKMLMGDKLTERFIGDARERIESALPKTSSDMNRFRAELGAAFRRSLSAELPGAGQVAARELGAGRIGEFKTSRLSLRFEPDGRDIPAMIISPTKISRALSRATIITHDDGISSVADEISGRLSEDARALLEAGQTVMTLDLFGSGGAAGYGDVGTMKHFDTYNRSVCSHRIQDVLAAIAHLISRHPGVEINLKGDGESGLIALLVAAAAMDSAETPGGAKVKIGRIIADAGGLDLSDDDEIADRFYMPGFRAAGDFRTASIMASGAAITIHNCIESFSIDGLDGIFGDSGWSPPDIRGERLSAREAADILLA